MNKLKELARLPQNGSTPEKIASLLADLFRVERHEIALLVKRGNLLKFVHPAELAKAGSIPLSSTAIAARTATSRRPEVFNDFGSVRHASIFELVKFGTSDSESSAEPATIQKLMSAAIVLEGETLGVVQVSRKASTRAQAGPDFTVDDLQSLEEAAAAIAPLVTGL